MGEKTVTNSARTSIQGNRQDVRLPGDERCEISLTVPSRTEALKGIEHLIDPHRCLGAGHVTSQDRDTPIHDPISLVTRQIRAYNLLTATEEKEVAEAVLGCRRELYEALFSCMPVARRAFTLMQEAATAARIQHYDRILHVSTVDSPGVKSAVLRHAVRNIQTVRLLFERLALCPYAVSAGSDATANSPQDVHRPELIRQKISRLLAEVPIRPTFRDVFIAQFQDYVATARTLHRDVERCEEPLMKVLRAGVLHDHLKESGESYESLHEKWTRVCRAQQDFLTAKEVLVIRNVRLAIGQARRFTKRGVPLEDLMQESIGGLMTAAEKYDPSRGYRFSTYATPWIRQALFRALGMTARTIRIPGSTSHVLRQVDTFANDFQGRQGRSPTPEEIEGAFKGRKLPFAVTADWLREMSVSALRVVSLEGSRSENAKARDWLESLVDKGDTPLEVAHTRIEAERRKEDIDRVLLQKLTPRQRQVMRLRFGLDGGGELTLREIGDKLGITRERVRQIEEKSIEVLQASELSKTHRRMR